MQHFVSERGQNNSWHCTVEASLPQLTYLRWPPFLPLCCLGFCVMSVLPLFLCRRIEAMAIKKKILIFRSSLKYDIRIKNMVRQCPCCNDAVGLFSLGHMFFLSGLTLSPLSVINGTVGWQVRVVSAAVWNPIFHFLQCCQTQQTHYYIYTHSIYADIQWVNSLERNSLESASWTIKVVCWVVFSKRHATDNNGELGTYGKAMAILCIHLEDASPTSASAVIPLSQPHFLFFFSPRGTPLPFPIVV